jgi:hypothetical protein
MLKQGKVLLHGVQVMKKAASSELRVMSCGESVELLPLLYSFKPISTSFKTSKNV